MVCVLCHYLHLGLKSRLLSVLFLSVLVMLDWDSSPLSATRDDALPSLWPRDALGRPRPDRFDTCAPRDAVPGAPRCAAPLRWAPAMPLPRDRLPEVPYTCNGQPCVPVSQVRRCDALCIRPAG